MNIPLSNSDLHDYGVNQSDILKYSQLADYQNINQLLPHDGDFKVLLLESEHNSGHWTCLVRKGNTIQYFNSYGEAPDKDLKIIPRTIKMILGEDHPEIERLMKGSGLKLIYNKNKYQAENSSVCGRYAVSAVHWLRQGKSMQTIKKILDALKKQCGSYDQGIISVTIPPRR